MPLYEYQCEKCGDRFEVMQKFADEPLTVHEKCGGDVHRLISAPMLHFKGSGWYVTDYAKGSSGANGNSSGTNGHKTNGHTSDSEPAPAKTEKPAATAPATTTPSPSSDKT
jgi:putative FmdB family regulatory protein